MSNKIKTKFGTAKLNKWGHFYITSSKEGNNSKYLHRLIFEDFYKTELPSNIVIHHDDGNPQNNEIWNLIPMTVKEHDELHRKQGRNIWQGKHHTNSSKQKISEKCRKYTFCGQNTFFKKRFSKSDKPTRCFEIRYNKKTIPIGYFLEWVSCDVINSLIEEAIL